MIRGLYGIADAGVAADPVRLALQLLDGGCRLLQLRAKAWHPDEVLRAAREIAPRCRALGATFLVNDWPEIAVASGADGVHVGQLDADPAAVRRAVGPHRIVGRSTHDEAQVALALQEADYLAFGPIWDSPHTSRPKGVRGPEQLARVRALVPPRVPLVAIGGITPERLGDVRRAGADAWAVIGAIGLAEDPVAATRAMVG